MPVAYRDKWNAIAEGVTTLSVYKPTLAVIGDLLIACLTVHKLVTENFTITKPTGWDLLYNTDIKGDGGARVASYWRILQSGDPDYWDWTTSLAVHGGLACAAYSGHDPSSPIPVKSAATDSGGDANVTATGITMPRDGMIVGHFGTRDSNPVTCTPPDGMTERVDQATSQGAFNDASQEVCDQQVSAGATGDKTAIFSGTVAYAGAHLLGIQEALKGYHMII